MRKIYITKCTCSLFNFAFFPSLLVAFSSLVLAWNRVAKFSLYRVLSCQRRRRRRRVTKLPENISALALKIEFNSANLHNQSEFRDSARRQRFVLVKFSACRLRGENLQLRRRRIWLLTRSSHYRRSRSKRLIFDGPKLTLRSRHFRFKEEAAASRCCCCCCHNYICQNLMTSHVCTWQQQQQRRKRRENFGTFFSVFNCHKAKA